MPSFKAMTRLLRAVLTRTIFYMYLVCVNYHTSVYICYIYSENQKSTRNCFSSEFIVIFKTTEISGNRYQKEIEMSRIKFYLIVLLISSYIITGFGVKKQEQGRTFALPLLIVPPTAPTRHQVSQHFL